MCGIAVAKNFEGGPVKSLVHDIFKQQRGRGTNGFGFIEIHNNKVFLKRFTKEADALEHLDRSEASEILFHHRAPTSTDNTVKTNHPIMADNDVYKHKYYIIHNGHINNSYLLKSEHEKLDIKYSSMQDYRFNDSESLMHELALIIEGKKEAKDFAAKGSLAFVLLQTDKANNPIALYYGRNDSNPLKLTQITGLMTLRSEGSSDNVEPNKLFRFDYKTKETTVENMDLGAYVQKPVRRYVSTESHPKELAEIVADMYECKYISERQLALLNNEELNSLVVIGRRVRQLLQMRQEKLMDGGGVAEHVFVNIDYNRCYSNLKTILEQINK